MEKRELSEKELREKKLSLAKGTKYLLDFMFYAGILQRHQTATKSPADHPDEKCAHLYPQ